MENVYKIKIRSNPNPSDVYPSERRYSSSIVLGLSVTYLALAITASLMGTLVVKKMGYNSTIDYDIDDVVDDQLLARINEDLTFIKSQDEHIVDVPSIVTAGVFIMAIGHYVSGFSGLLAWKHWYIDNNITWFFLSCCFSAITSSVSFLLINLALIDKKVLNDQHSISAGLIANIFITSLLGLIWSMVASNIAFKGMKSNYPDDLIISRNAGGKIQVSTIWKGNKNAKIVPPDILNNFPKSGKFARCLPTNESGLPKMESCKEYEDRVKQFLEGNTDSLN